ncbi:aldo/keto reductase [Actinoallomurus rhizosphaericola]|uniref:aldo/keto reductase n=1 Tax=Actinoallomurus rhizosphaericola TaxID=2952536 RepID=UPI0020929180|nr:aldo/keto reductase [Actinoallomurus rhizosphaericola]MCO5995041.1 aldo/keto reductase [Actinoallomurus rhizosphaericola]
MRRFADRHVGAVGLGCTGMSRAYAESEPNDRRSVALIREAVDLGVTFLDTGDVYGAGHNETLVGRAVRGIRDLVVVGTRVGLVADPETGRIRCDGTPAYVRGAVEASLRRLETETVDLYYLHRVDPEVPLAETWGAMAELVAEGKVRHLGLSQVTVAQAEEAHRIHPVAAIRSELSLWIRDPLGTDARRGCAGGHRSADGQENGDGRGNVVGWCAAKGAAFVSYAPLGRGNLRVADVVRKVAERHAVTPAQVAIAWTLAQGGHVIPVPGTTRQSHLYENTRAAGVDLSEDDLAELDAAPGCVTGP